MLYKEGYACSTLPDGKPLAGLNAMYYIEWMPLYFLLGCCWAGLLGPNGSHRPEQTRERATF